MKSMEVESIAIMPINSRGTKVLITEKILNITLWIMLDS